MKKVLFGLVLAAALDAAGYVFFRHFVYNAAILSTQGVIATVLYKVLSYDFQPAIRYVFFRCIFDADKCPLLVGNDHTFHVFQLHNISHLVAEKVFFLVNDFLFHLILVLISFSFSVFITEYLPVATFWCGESGDLASTSPDTSSPLERRRAYHFGGDEVSALAYAVSGCRMLAFRHFRGSIFLLFVHFSDKRTDFVQNMLLHLVRFSGKLELINHVRGFGHEFHLMVRFLA